MAVFEKVQEIIVEELGKEPSEVTLESTFEDLEADSDRKSVVWERV